jgi:hypothetical protein
MLRPDPAQAGRLSEIIENLGARLAEAHQQGWLGEVDGLEVGLAAAKQKLAGMRRPAVIPVTTLSVGPAPLRRRL